MPKLQSTKIFPNYPCSHRQHLHQGHCAYVHGYSRSFHFKFEADELDQFGFVMDFGSLKWVKAFLEDHFDHTLLINEADPLLDTFRDLARAGAAKLVVLPNVGMEGTAKWLYEELSPRFREQTLGRVRIVEIEVRENDKNSAIYIP
tara:strand:+ start:2551 stop:2988 length:438 start_codon:yes stop_codon:yes gene_type:complete